MYEKRSNNLIVKMGAIILIIVMILSVKIYGSEKKLDDRENLPGQDTIISEEEIRETMILKEKEASSPEIYKIFAGEAGAKLLSNPIEGVVVEKKLEYGQELKVVSDLIDGWVRVEHENKFYYTKLDELTKDYTPPYEANTIYFMGKAVKFYNTGMNACQSQIDKAPETAATFGGNPTFSGVDNQNTHFAAHNHGAFNGLWNINKGEEIVVTDGNAKPYTYKVNDVKKVTYEGFGYRDNVDYWPEITGKGSTERITLQTCIFGDPNGVWIINANLK